ncbi:MAG: hypothetical protein IPL61_05950 [Myxococcales bacterium]|nr:hypothetical protein [Myxococcales bacterium]
MRWLLIVTCWIVLAAAGAPAAVAQPADDELATIDEAEPPPPTPAPARDRATAMMVRSSLTLILLIVVGGYVLRQTGGGRGGLGGIAGSYYLFWLVVPVVLAIVTAYPLVLIVVVVGVAARPWLPDPYQYLRHARRAHGLEAQVRQNPANAVARRELAMMWIERRRPRRALPHLAAARAREPEDLELRMLEGQALALAGRSADAAAEFLAVGEAAPRFRYGAPWLARADALAEAGRWPEAEAALRQFQATNSSSLEGHVKLARARARQGDGAGAAAERRSARALYAELPRFQRRHQRWWYLRAIVGW